MEKLVRLKVHRYIKSGKLSAFSGHTGYKGYIVIDFYPNLVEIKCIRSISYIKRGIVSGTKYIAELEETIEKTQDKETYSSYKLIRILTNDDLDEKKWKNTVQLNKLPVSPSKYITPEEELWAGKRDGNIFSLILLLLSICLLCYLAYSSFKADSIPYFSGTIIIICFFILLFNKWKMPKKPDPQKLNELKNYKTAMEDSTQLREKQAQLQFEESLKIYDYWEGLSPRRFERGIKLKLRDEGYNLNVTQYLGDGGVDLEGVDENGYPVTVSQNMCVQGTSFTENC